MRSLLLPPTRTRQIGAVLVTALSVLLSSCGGGGAGSPSAAPSTGAPTPAPAPAPTPVPPPAPVLPPATARSPVVTAVQPAELAPPGQLTIQGADLDLAERAWLNDAQLRIVSRSATSWVVEVPAQASSGLLTIETTDGRHLPTAASVNLVGPVSVTSFSPASLLQGDQLRISGGNLARVSAVRFGNGTLSGTPTLLDPSTIVVRVPDDAASGPIGLLTRTGELTQSPASLTVVPRIRVRAAESTLRVKAGAVVRIEGSALNQVRAVNVGPFAATIGSRSEAAISFTVPAGAYCGDIALISATQPPVNAGALVVDAGCMLRTASVEFAQVLSHSATDASLRLVPGKETWLRAIVTSSVAGTSAPRVRAIATIGNQVAGSLDLRGPAVLPTLQPGAPLPVGLRYEDGQAFTVRLPDAWIVPGLSVRVEADADARFGAPAVAVHTPEVGIPTHYELVLVPLVAGSHQPTAPAIEAVIDELSRRMPYSRDAIRVTLRAPHRLSSVADGVKSADDWARALSELEQLRRAEAPDRVYYGLVRPAATAGIAGISYVNTSADAASTALSALGWDASQPMWRTIMTHELGHNHGLLHAPCGVAGITDPTFPYAQGRLGEVPLFDSIDDVVLAPSGESDVMGYCGGTWFSDHNFRRLQNMAEQQRLQMVWTASKASATKTRPTGALLHLSGRIDATGLQLDPPQPLYGAMPAPAARGDHVLRLVTAKGQRIDVPVQSIALAGHGGVTEAHFHAVVPNPGPLERVELLRHGVALPQRQPVARAQSAEVGRATSPTAEVQAQEGRDGRLQLRWNVEHWPRLSVTHVGANQRRVLALGLRSGTATLDLSGLPPGGHLEFGLGGGMDARTLTLNR